MGDVLDHSMIFGSGMDQYGILTSTADLAFRVRVAPSAIPAGPRPRRTVPVARPSTAGAVCGSAQAAGTIARKDSGRVNRQLLGQLSLDVRRRRSFDLAGLVTDVLRLVLKYSWEDNASIGEREPMLWCSHC